MHCRKKLSPLSTIGWKIFGLSVSVIFFCCSEAAVKVVGEKSPYGISCFEEITYVGQRGFNYQLLNSLYGQLLLLPSVLTAQLDHA